MKKIKYLGVALRNFHTVGNFIPSQRFLVRELTRHINPNSKCIVEFGTGEGCVTRAIEKRVNKDCIILTFELNAKMIELAKRTAKSLSKDNGGPRENTIFINDNVFNLDKYLKELNISKVDYIISSLPLAHFKKDKIDLLMENSKKVLVPGGNFMQYQYLARNLPDLRKHFSNIVVKWIPLNFLPAFVYICKI